MILFANMVRAVAVMVELANGLLTIYKYLLLASVIISWVNADPYNPIVNFIYRATEPLLRPIRRVVPSVGMIDFSPMLAFAAIYILQIVLLDTVYQYLTEYSYALRVR